MDETEQTASKPAAENPTKELAQPPANLVRKSAAAAMGDKIPVKHRKTCRYKPGSVSNIAAALATGS